MITLGFWDKRDDYQFLPVGDRPNHCWSTWLRNPDYTGPLIRIATSETGNAELDIYPSDNRVNIDAIINHVGINKALIVTFYDQFGGVNLSGYANINWWPKIADNGIITDDSGNPTIQWGAGTSGFLSTLMREITTNVFPSRSTVFYTYKSIKTGYSAIAGSSNNNAGHAITHITDTQFASIFWDPNPQYLFVNENIEISSNVDATRTNFYTKLNTGDNLLVAEKDGAWAQGTGIVLGGRNESTNTFFEGQMNEYMIYNTILSDSKIQEIQSILNSAHNYY